MLEGNSYTGSDQAKHLSETTFQLKKRGVSHQSVSVSVDFSPALRPINTDKQQHSTLTKSIPIFNMDGNFFTPAFILEIDKEKYTSNCSIYKEMFVKKVDEADEELTEMYLPKPSKVNSFCCVCKTFFDDYLTHVNLPLHRTFMEKSEFHNEIESLCQKITHPTNKKTVKQPKTKSTKTKQVKKEPKSQPKTKKPRKSPGSPKSAQVQGIDELITSEMK